MEIDTSSDSFQQLVREIERQTELTEELYKIVCGKEPPERGVTVDEKKLVDSLGKVLDERMGA